LKLKCIILYAMKSSCAISYISMELVSKIWRLFLPLAWQNDAVSDVPIHYVYTYRCCQSPVSLSMRQPTRWVVSGVRHSLIIYGKYGMLANGPSDCLFTAFLHWCTLVAMFPDWLTVNSVSLLKLWDATRSQWPFSLGDSCTQ
jgi:hypothetical protein